MKSAEAIKLHAEKLGLRVGRPFKESTIAPSQITVDLPTDAGNWLNVYVTFDDGREWSITYQGDYTIWWAE